MTLWTSAEAAVATGGEVTRAWTANGVSIDTRTLIPGDLFVALKAARDGHDFVAQALEKGATAALVTHRPEGVTEDAPLLIVKDVQTGLEALGQAARARMGGKVAAVTGSVGKTSTKEMLRVMLSANGKTHCAEASYNNHWGVPLTLARMPRDAHFAVIEIGMNHPGEIAPLSLQARPDVAMITIVAPAHLAAFGSIDGIAEEKATIFDGLSPGGAAIYNADLETSDILEKRAIAAQANPVPFGTTAENYHLRSAEIVDGKTIVEAMIEGAPVGFTLATAGRHFAMNALGAIALCDALGADRVAALGALESWNPYRGRGVSEDIQLPTGNITLIDDSYNANPASVAAALDVLAATKGARRIAILGDMKELGETELALHAALAGHPAVAEIDIFHTVGPLMQALHAALPSEKRGVSCDTAAEMAGRITDQIGAGDTVLIKGSLSTGLARVVDAIRKLPQDRAEQ